MNNKILCKLLAPDFKSSLQTITKAFDEARRSVSVAAFCLGVILLGAVCPVAGAQAGEWTWMGGSSTVPASDSGQPGVYGTLGEPASGNIPGGRGSAASWTDSSGNFWLFGGEGESSTVTSQFELNDLWKFDPSTHEWTWKSGSDADDMSGVYGSMGTPDAGNIPGGRYSAAYWIDSNGNFWLFGGYGYDSSGSVGYLNDLWKFNPSTIEWAWMSGSNNGDLPGVYGTVGTPAAGNFPGGRLNANNWTDSNGHLWLFGGLGYFGDGNFGYLNDLWEFSPSTNEWVWKGGSSTLPAICAYDTTSFCGQSGVYGTFGTSAFPGGRAYATNWTDSSGNFWLFGGNGVDASGSSGGLNDLWEFNPSTNEWAWMGGSDSVEHSYPGVYGTLGAPAAGNIPGERMNTSSWTDSGGNLWLFGGYGSDASGGGGYLNDLWEFNPSTNEWAWMGGSSTVGNNGGRSGVYGTLGSPAPGNTPGGRTSSQSWTDSSSHLWLFGGVGFDYNGTQGYLNDLWEFQSYAAAATPTFSVTAGTYTTTQMVTISDATAGATIYYTTNDTAPRPRRPGR